jgi:exodeoxyribonuclease V alpha subunit
LQKTGSKTKIFIFRGKEMTQQLTFDLTTLHDLQLISHLDYYFAKTMADSFFEKNSLVLASCALVSKVLSEGHICLSLKNTANTCLGNLDEDVCIKLPDYNQWVKALTETAMVATPFSDSIGPGLSAPDLTGPDLIGPELIGSDLIGSDLTGSDMTGLGKKTPMVLDPAGNLYLSKYYDFQERLVLNLGYRIEYTQKQMDKKFVDKYLDHFFSGQNSEDMEKQREAVNKALTSNFVVISGGPGTGKTHITTIIRTILELYAKEQEKPLPRIISVAPTGKAASRLTDGATIHSVLKPLKNKFGFLYTKKNPLAVDVVIIDEASMIDIALMTRLLEAIPLGAKVIMLGDKNQLSPVQAGAVFTDICGVKGMGSNLVFLEFNFRSRGKTGIENLAHAIIQNDAKKVESILGNSQYQDIEYQDIQKGKERDRIIEKHIINGYGQLTGRTNLLDSLDDLDRFRILCAHNNGESGTLQVNHVCEKILRLQANFDMLGHFFKKIVMIRLNDYHHGLFNGDTGIVHEENKVIKVGFRDAGGNIRQYRYLDLPAHDTAFAVTIHKSQGSEFDIVLIIIPEKLSPIVTRQLLYTGVTRARKKAIIVGSLDVIKEAMALTPGHTSNFADLLELRLGNYDKKD